MTLPKDTIGQGPQEADKPAQGADMLIVGDRCSEHTGYWNAQPTNRRHYCTICFSQPAVPVEATVLALPLKFLTQACASFAFSGNIRLHETAPRPTR